MLITSFTLAGWDQRQCNDARTWNLAVAHQHHQKSVLLPSLLPPPYLPPHPPPPPRQWPVEVPMGGKMRIPPLILWLRCYLNVLLVLSLKVMRTLVPQKRLQTRYMLPYYNLKFRVPKGMNLSCPNTWMCPTLYCILRKLLFWSYLSSAMFL